MTIYEQQQWKERCQWLSANYPHYVFFYDSSEGWCNASYKKHIQKLTYRMSKETIEMALQKLIQ